MKEALNANKVSLYILFQAFATIWNIVPFYLVHQKKKTFAMSTCASMLSDCLGESE